MMIGLNFVLIFRRNSVPWNEMVIYISLRGFKVLYMIISKLFYKIESKIVNVRLNFNELSGFNP